MNKKYIIRKNEEIQVVLKKSKKVVNKYYIVYYVNNNYLYNRYCVSVSKKIGKANIRNLYKRRIKDILQKNNFDTHNDYVIILRNAVLNVNYNVLKNELVQIIGGNK